MFHIYSSQISFADYNLFDILLNLKVLSSTCLDTFPALKSFVDKTAARPKVKALLESDDFRKCPSMAMANSNSSALDNLLKQWHFLLKGLNWCSVI